MDTRCFPCLRQRDYDEDASPLVDPISRDRVSVAASLALEETERRVAATLHGGGDSSVYVGAPGIAYYLYRAGDAAGARALLSRRARARGDGVDCSIACGATGVDLVAAVVAESDEEFSARAYAVVDRVDVAVLGELDCDEWLYGRAGSATEREFGSRRRRGGGVDRPWFGARGSWLRRGGDLDRQRSNAGRPRYLRALLGLEREARRRGVTLDVAAATRRVVEAMLASGRAHDGLRYRWYGEEYLGAAHGYAGIVYLLLRAGCRDSAVRATADRLLSLETRANYPAVGGEARADLVHWCHGAPGFVYVFAEAYRAYVRGADGSA